MVIVVSENKENNKKYFDEMVKKIYSNGIQTTFEYEDYFNNLVYAIRHGWIDDYFYYAVALSTAEINDNNQKGIRDSLLSYNFRKGVKSIIAESVRQQLNGVDIGDYLNKMMRDIEEHTISLEQYYSYFENLELINMADIASIDILNYIKALLNAKISSPKTYVDVIKYDKHQKELSRSIAELEQNKLLTDPKTK